MSNLTCPSSPKTPLRWVKLECVVGEFVDIIKMWVNLFHFCGRWVKIFWNGLYFLGDDETYFLGDDDKFTLSFLLCHPLNQTLYSPTTVDEFTHFKTVCFLHPHYFKANHSRNSPIQLLSDGSIWGTTRSTQLSHIQIRHKCDMCEWVPLAQSSSPAWRCCAECFFLAHSLTVFLVLFLFFSHRNIHDCSCEQDKHTFSRTTRQQLQCSPV